VAKELDACTTERFWHRGASGAMRSGPALVVVVALCCDGASAFTKAPRRHSLPTICRAGFGKAKPSAKAVQIASGPKPMDRQWSVRRRLFLRSPSRDRRVLLGTATSKSRKRPAR